MKRVIHRVSGERSEESRPAHFHEVGYPLHSGNPKGLWVDARRVHPIAREETLHCVHARVQRLLRAGWLFSGLLRRTPPAGNQKHPAHRFGSPADGFATAATTTYCGYLSQVASPLHEHTRFFVACGSSPESGRVSCLDSTNSSHTCRVHFLESRIAASGYPCSE
jgi:hypothetical protein